MSTMNVVSFLCEKKFKHLCHSNRFFFFLDNASTTETDDKQPTEDIEDIDEEEGTDGVSSEGEKPGGANESLQV